MIKITVISTVLAVLAVLAVLVWYYYYYQAKKCLPCSGNKARVIRRVSESQQAARNERAKVYELVIQAKAHYDNGRDREAMNSYRDAVRRARILKMDMADIYDPTLQDAYF